VWAWHCWQPADTKKLYKRNDYGVHRSPNFIPFVSLLVLPYLFYRKLVRWSQGCDSDIADSLLTPWSFKSPVHKYIGLNLAQPTRLYYSPYHKHVEQEGLITAQTLTFLLLTASQACETEPSVWHWHCWHPVDTVKLNASGAQVSQASPMTFCWQ